MKKRRLRLSALLFTVVFLGMHLGSYAQDSGKKEVPPEERAQEITTRLAKKIPMTKGQKDSVSTAFMQLLDDVQKYNAMNNPKILELLIHNRDEKVKKILHDDQKFDQFLLIMADMRKEMQENQGQQRYQQQQQRQGGQRGGMPAMPGGGMPGGR